MWSPWRMDYSGLNYCITGCRIISTPSLHSTRRLIGSTRFTAITNSPITNSLTFSAKSDKKHREIQFELRRNTRWQSLLFTLERRKHGELDCCIKSFVLHNNLIRKFSSPLLSLIEIPSGALTLHNSSTLSENSD